MFENSSCDYLVKKYVVQKFHSTDKCRQKRDFILISRIT